MGNMNHLSFSLVPQGHAPRFVLYSLGTFTVWFTAGSRHLHEAPDDNLFVMNELGSLGPGTTLLFWKSGTIFHIPSYLIFY
jgi:hypothetical protein